MGQAIKVTIEKMKRKFGVEVNLNTPKVPYKETIKGKTNVQGKYKKQSADAASSVIAGSTSNLCPAAADLSSAIKSSAASFPDNTVRLSKKALWKAAKGVIAGYPFVDFKINLTFGSYHTVDSEMAFKIAGSMAFQKGVMDCQPILLNRSSTSKSKFPMNTWAM